MNKLFNFFKLYDNSKHEIGVDRVIMTEYKKQLSYENVPAYIEMFYKKPNDFVVKYLHQQIYLLSLKNMRKIII